MNQRVNELASQAAALSREEQLTLIGRLRELAEPTNPDVDATWIAHGEAQMAAYEKGELETYDADQVLAELRLRSAQRLPK